MVLSFLLSHLFYPQKYLSKQKHPANTPSPHPAKSAKLRRKAAKRARKLEAMRLAAGEAAPEARIPITQQSIDLPFNSEGTTKGALDAEGKREELRGAMRRERRKGIKEANFLRGM